MCCRTAPNRSSAWLLGDVSTEVEDIQNRRYVRLCRTELLAPAYYSVSARQHRARCSRRGRIPLKIIAERGEDRTAVRQVAELARQRREPGDGPPPTLKAGTAIGDTLIVNIQAADRTCTAGVRWPAQRVGLITAGRR